MCIARIFFLLKLRFIVTNESNNVTYSNKGMLVILKLLYTLYFGFCQQHDKNNFLILDMLYVKFEYLKKLKI